MGEGDSEEGEEEEGPFFKQPGSVINERVTENRRLHE